MTGMVHVVACYMFQVPSVVRVHVVARCGMLHVHVVACYMLRTGEAMLLQTAMLAKPEGLEFLVRFVPDSMYDYILRVATSTAQDRPPHTHEHATSYPPTRGHMCGHLCGGFTCPVRRRCHSCACIRATNASYVCLLKQLHATGTLNPAVPTAALGPGCDGLLNRGPGPTGRQQSHEHEFCICGRWRACIPGCGGTKLCPGLLHDDNFGDIRYAYLFAVCSVQGCLCLHVAHHTPNKGQLGTNDMHAGVGTGFGHLHDGVSCCCRCMR